MTEDQDKRIYAALAIVNEKLKEIQEIMKEEVEPVSGAV